MKTQYDIKRGVSLYSYQDHFYFRKLDLEDCIAAVADLDAEGFEIMPEMMIREWPHISDDFAAKWYGWMERYDVVPAVLSHFSDRAMWKNRQLTDDELYERSILYIKAANKLGCKMIRLMHSRHGGANGFSTFDLVNPQIAERLLPICEKYDVTMALECHAPTSIDDPCHLPYLEAVERTGIKRIGLQVDMSSFQTEDSVASRDFHVRQGGNPALIDCIRAEGAKKAKGEFVDEKSIQMYLEKNNANQVDMHYFDNQVKHAMVATTNKTLQEYAPHIVYVHAKFNWANEDGSIDEIDYHGALEALCKGGYKGFINSEFEGNRWMNDLGEVDEVEQVRRQHALFKQILGY